MKVRSDFVTNSSSSSFVIAIKNDVSDKVIDDYINKLMPEIIERLSEWFDADEIDESNIKEDFVDTLYNARRCGIKADSWLIYCTTISSEDNAFPAYLYSNGLPETDWLKSGMGD